MTTLLTRCGEALYGSRWQSDLAAALGISPRHMRRLASGAAEVRPGMWLDIMLEMEKREAILVRLHGECFNAYCKPG